nr:helix-turn-helix transcriptional regulator [Kineosphaera limosa]
MLAALRNPPAPPSAVSSSATPSSATPPSATPPSAAPSSATPSSAAPSPASSTPGEDPPAQSGSPDLPAELTARELEVLTLIGRGRTNAEIATELYIAQTTVKTHVGNLLLKLAARDRVALVVLAHGVGLVGPLADDDAMRTVPLR